jgi:hypothetical protein
MKQNVMLTIASLLSILLQAIAATDLPLLKQLGDTYLASKTSGNKAALINLVTAFAADINAQVYVPWRKSSTCSRLPAPVWWILSLSRSHGEWRWCFCRVDSRAPWLLPLGG